jgi:cytochrome c-type biogenesis protein CcmF
MLALLGTAGVIAALIGSLLLVVRGMRLTRGMEADLKSPASLVLAGALVAMAAMQIALLSDDFSLAYVANHHSVATPFPFDAATAWAALEGSIVLWGLVLAVFTWMTARRLGGGSDRLGAAAVMVMGGVAIFFFGLMITVANPFEVCVDALDVGCAGSSAWPFAVVEAPANGPGPNPLLQNHFLMAVHPPVLYVGYVGLTVPFAYAIGALALGTPGPEWLRRSHRSTLVAWSFLTLGIGLGGWWAYEVLSWGGYWAWDPVENASLMPWLAATAFIHSGLVQRRREMLQAWNFVLVISAFALTILGTFLTRSGTINSVHSFTQSAIGPALLGFLVLVLVGSFTLFAMRSHLVASSPRIESFVSREGTFLVNNLLLTVYAFVVLIGTTYPLLLEAFTGTQVGVGEPFFNRLAVPLSFMLLLTMGFGPITPWRGAAPGLLWSRLRTPTVLALAAGLLVAVTVTRVGWVILAIVLGMFVIGVIVGLLLELAAARASRSGRPLLEEVITVIGNDPPFWAGQVSHIGVVLVAVGIAFAANLPLHAEVELAPGESVEFAGYILTYEAPFRRDEPNRAVEGARVSVHRDDRRVGTLEPRANFYLGVTGGIVTPAVMARPGGDLYLTLRNLDTETVELGLDTSPMIWLVWLGGLTTATGGFWSLSARRRRQVIEPEPVLADV